MSKKIETLATKAAFISKPQGGGGGNAFSDETEAKSGPISKITVRHGSEIDQIEVFYAGRAGGRHGGGGGNPGEFTLNPGYNIVTIRGRAGSRIDQLQFLARDSAGNWQSSPVFGGSGGHEFEITQGALPLRFIEGRSGAKLDQIRFAFGYPCRIKNLKLDNDAIQKQLLKVQPTSINRLIYNNTGDNDLEGRYTDSLEIAEEHTFHWEYSSGFTYGSRLEVGVEGIAKEEISFSISVNATVGNSETIKKTKTRTWDVPYTVPKHTSTKINVMAREAQLREIPFTYEVEFYDPRTGQVVDTSIEKGTYDGVIVSDINFVPEHTPLTSSTGKQTELEER